MDSAANRCFSFASSSLVSFGSLRSWVHGVGTSLRVARSRRYDGRCPRFTSTVDPSCNRQRCPDRQKQHEKMGREWDENGLLLLGLRNIWRLVSGTNLCSILFAATVTRIILQLVCDEVCWPAKAEFWLCWSNWGCLHKRRPFAPRTSRLIQTSSRSTHVRSRRSRLPLESWCSATARRELQLLSSHLQRMGMVQLGASMSLQMVPNGFILRYSTRFQDILTIFKP